LIFCKIWFISLDAFPIWRLSTFMLRMFLLSAVTVYVGLSVKIVCTRVCLRIGAVAVQHKVLC
jgi:hypothetical protein